MKKLSLSLALFVGCAGLAQAASVSGGAFRTFMKSSGVVFNDGGSLWGIQCSTAATAQQNLNTYYVQFFDSATTGGTGLLAAGGVDLSNNFASTASVTVTPPIIMGATNTVATNGSMFVGVDYSNFGGLHINNDLYFFMSASFPGTGCTVIWKRENRGY